MLSARWRLRLMRFYPPFFGAGIRARRTERGFEAWMPLTWYNRNYVGTHFGGSLYALCDPFFMLILVEKLGPDYIVWDKSATIQFRRPGRSTVRASFEIPEERVAEIRAAADRDGKCEPRFETEIVDPAGEVVARVEKLLHVRRKA